MCFSFFFFLNLLLRVIVQWFQMSRPFNKRWREPHHKNTKCTWATPQWVSDRPLAPLSVITTPWGFHTALFLLVWNFCTWSTLHSLMVLFLFFYCYLLLSSVTCRMYSLMFHTWSFCYSTVLCSDWAQSAMDQGMYSTDMSSAQRCSKKNFNELSPSHT